MPSSIHAMLRAIDLELLAQPAFSLPVGGRGPIVRRMRTNERYAGLRNAMRLSPDERAARARSYRLCVEQGGVAQFDAKLRLPSGFHWWRTSLTPLARPDGTVFGILGLCTDITEAKAKERGLEIAAFEDALTGLMNRRRFDLDLRRAIEDACAAGRRFSLAIADVDRFKTINDTYGHAVGDEVLKAVAQGLRANLRGDDRVYRYGGDEFAAILATPSAGALPALLGRVEDCLARIASLHRPVWSVSIGRVHFSPGMWAGEILRLADIDMYARKAATREGFKDRDERFPA